MSREVCGICWCPYDEYTGECACPPPVMRDDTALLQQALEALEAASSCLDGYYVPLGKTNIPEAEEAIAALRERLGEKT